MTKKQEKIKLTSLFRVRLFEQYYWFFSLCINECREENVFVHITEVEE